jgi:hypothetical protein
MIRTAGVPGNACAVCTFPKAALPEIQGLAATALHHAKQTCARPNARRQVLRPSMTFMRLPHSPWTPQVRHLPALTLMAVTMGLWLGSNELQGVEFELAEWLQAQFSRLTPHHEL